VEWVALSWVNPPLESWQARDRRTGNHAIQVRLLRWTHRVAALQGRLPKSFAEVGH
jgi:hypothetical protein